MNWCLMSSNFGLFADTASAGSYVLETPRKVPGLADLHRMVTLLVAERAPADAHVLVVGAGGGLEIRAMAEARPDWRFTGVDPSSAMLDVARQTTSACAERTQFILGRAIDAPPGPFDAAVCLLTLHFLDRDERLETLQEIGRRLRPGGTLVAAHHTAVGGEAEAWLRLSAAFAGGASGDPEKAAASARVMAGQLPLLSPEGEEDLFRDAGFLHPALFYAAFSFRGWVMTRPGS